MEATALPRGGGRIKLRQSIAKSSAVSCRSAHSRLAPGRSIGAARNSGKTRPEGRALSFWDVALIPQASQKLAARVHFISRVQQGESRFPFTSLCNTDGLAILMHYPRWHH